MATVLFTFPDSTTRDQFMGRVQSLIDAGDDLMSKLQMETDPDIKELEDYQTYLFISNKKITSGKYHDMIQRFNLEASMHKANIELRQERKGVWTVIKRRKVRL
jgi:hypothetical protein